ncbi:hypothetical protein STEG23_014037, partial [Scotinomys teguina]
ILGLMPPSAIPVTVILATRNEYISVLLWTLYWIKYFMFITLVSPTWTQEHPDAIGPQGPRSTQTPSDHKVGDPYSTQRVGIWDSGLINPTLLRRSSLSPTGLPRPSSGTPENSPCPHPYLSSLESCPSHSLGPRSTRMPLNRKDPGAPTPFDQKDPGAPRRHWTRRTQEYPDDSGPRGPRSTPDVIRPGGPRSTQKPLDQEDPGAPKQH